MTVTMKNIGTKLPTISATAVSIYIVSLLTSRATGAAVVSTLSTARAVTAGASSSIGVLMGCEEPLTGSTAMISSSTTKPDGMIHQRCFLFIFTAPSTPIYCCPVTLATRAAGMLIIGVELPPPIINGGKWPSQRCHLISSTY